MKYFIVLIVVVLVAAAGGWIAHSYYGATFPPAGGGEGEAAAEPAGRVAAEETTGPRPVVALGWLEPAGGVIEISGVPGDRLAEILVAEGSLVAKGEPLAYLASRRAKQLEVESLESRIREAEARQRAETKLADANIVTAELGVERVNMQELDIRSLQRKIDLSKANVELARKDYQRLRNLPEDLVSPQELERQDMLVRQAEAELAAAEVELEKFERTRQFTEKSAKAELEAARAGKEQVLASIPVDSLKSQLEMARTQLAQTEIIAPAAGTALKVFMEPGESVGQKPILQLADLGRMVAVAEVYETDVKRIQPGQPAIVTSEAFVSPYDERGLQGEVVQISKLITTPELKSLDPFARADRHVMGVRIALDEEGSRQAAGFVNLQVEVTFPSSAAAAD